MRSVLAQYAAMSKRAILGIIRQPAAIVPPMVFPLFFMAMTSAALDRSTSLPGFPPVDSFLQFAVAAAILQGAMFGSIQAGSGMATDIEGGFYERLIASPVARTSILVARVTGAALMGFVQAWLFMGVVRIFGAEVEGGLPAMLGVAVVASLFSAGVGSITMAFALKSGSTEAVQGSFPLMFALMFLSSAFFPRALMSGWFETAATINPISHLVEGMRTQIIAGFDLADLTTALAVAGGILVFGVALSGTALRGRLAQHT